MSGTPDLAAAYVHTTYWVDARPEPLALRIDEASPALDRMLSERSVSRWAFVTAWNPRSQLRAHWYNVSRHETLLRTLRRAGWQWLPALAHGDAGDWPAEPGVLILGITRAQAYRLGRRFRQNAVVAGERGRAARLVWCWN
jgi:hypothetical protein